MKRYFEELESKNILVIGLGISGMETVRFLGKFKANVFVHDNKSIEAIDVDIVNELKKLGVHASLGVEPDNIESMDLIVVSPGVPLNLGFLIKAKENNVEIIGELELAYRLTEGKFIAITGTNGKTTTTSLVGEIFKASGRDTRIVGNIGSPIISEVLSADENTYFVTEVSSFQLESTKLFSPFVSSILNLTPDHMDRHKTMENYGAIKSKINLNQEETGFAIVNFDDKVAMSLATRTKAKVVPFSKYGDLKFGACVEHDIIKVIDENGKEHEVINVDELQIPGGHNLENALAAVAMAFFAGISLEVIRDTLLNFKGVEHRLEDCGEVDGVQFINDSKGTNTDASIKALEAMSKPIVLIAGGYDKKANFESFVEAFGDKVQDLVLLGATAVKIKNTAEQKGFNNTIVQSNMEECVREAFRRAKSGWVVLLSPACASWDMYNSYEERGREFKNIVEKLKSEQELGEEA